MRIVIEYSGSNRRYNSSGGNWCVLLIALCFGRFIIVIRTFDTGFTLAITAVAATTLTTGAATRTITALCVVSTFGCFILQQFFVWQLVLRFS